MTYGCETWTLTLKDTNNLRIFESKILRKIYGPIQVNSNLWRIRTNKEIEALIKCKDIVKFIKAQRLSWLGHIERQTDKRVAKFLYWKPMCNRPRGIPKKRWLDDVLNDIKCLRITNWKGKTKDRAVWKGIVQQAKAHHGL